MLLIATTGFSQEIRKEVDEFTQETAYLVDKNLEFEGISLIPYLRPFHGGKTHCFELITKTSIRCLKNSELIIVLEDGSKIYLRSWNKDNCNGCSFFKLRNSAIKKLKTKKISKLKFINNDTGETITVYKESDYFIKLYEEITLKNIIGYGK